MKLDTMTDRNHGYEVTDEVHSVYRMKHIHLYINVMHLYSPHFRLISVDWHLKADTTMSIIKTFVETFGEGFESASSCAQGEYANHYATYMGCQGQNQT